MKRLLAMLLAALMLCSLTACGEDEEEFVYEGEFTLPTQEQTTAPTSAAPSTEPATAPTEAAPTLAQQYILYCGRWNSTTQYHYMELFIEGEVLYLDYTCMSGNGNRIAQTFSSVALSDIRNNKVTFTYSDDGWGNSGTLELEFVSEQQLVCTATTTYKDPGANWSIVEGTVTFERAA